MYKYNTNWIALLNLDVAKENLLVMITGGCISHPWIEAKAISQKTVCRKNICKERSVNFS